jgi:hypothetical protein
MDVVRDVEMLMGKEMCLPAGGEQTMASVFSGSGSVTRPEPPRPGAGARAGWRWRPGPSIKSLREFTLFA